MNTPFTTPIPSQRVCRVPGCGRSYHRWQSNPRGSQPYVFSVSRSAVLAQLKKKVQLETEVKYFCVCDIHYTREDFYPYYKDLNYPSHLLGLRKNPIAVPSLYLDKEQNLAAKIIAKAIDEPDWWKLIEVTSVNDIICLPENAPNQSATEVRGYINQSDRGVRVNSNVAMRSTPLHDHNYNDSSRQTNCDFNNAKENFLTIYTSPNQRLPTKKTKSIDNLCVTLECIEQDQFEAESPMLNDDCNYLDSTDDDSDIVIIEPKAEVLVDESPAQPPVNVKRNTKFIAEQIENAKKKLHLFRMLSSTIIRLPSPLWAVHPNYDSKNVVICKVLHSSDGFQVERGICFNDRMTWPDIRINGKKIVVDSSELTCIADIENLVHKIDIYIVK